MKTSFLIKFLAGAVAGVVSLGVSASCYSVYSNSTNTLMFQSTEAPVDMSRSVTQSVSRKFPGGHMIFSTAGGEQCPEVKYAAVTDATNPTTAAKGKRSKKRNWDKAPGYEK